MELKEVTLTIPCIPPTVNHYWIRRRDGRGYFLSPNARAFKETVAIFARGAKLEGKQYALDAVVYLGKRQKGDGDNFLKPIGDSLQKAGIIQSDAKIKDWRIRVDRDWEQPRTVLTVRIL
jgi:Holliday junction resolvase RusA-like endonuclease